MKQINNYIIEKLNLNKDIKDQKERNIYDPNEWVVGDILLTSGGYNMTLVWFWKIIKKIGNKSFVVKRLKKKIVKGSGQQGECIALDEFDERDEQYTVRINKYNDININGHYAALWDGKPEYFSTMD